MTEKVAMSHSCIPTMTVNLVNDRREGTMFENAEAASGLAASLNELLSCHQCQAFLNVDEDLQEAGEDNVWFVEVLFCGQYGAPDSHRYARTSIQRRHESSAERVIPS